MIQVQLPLSMANVQHVQHGRDGMDHRDKVMMGLVLSCPFLQEQSNSFFLVWIMIVMAKLRLAIDHDRTHYKALPVLIKDNITYQSKPVAGAQGKRYI